MAELYRLRIGVERQVNCLLAASWSTWAYDHHQARRLAIGRRRPLLTKLQLAPLIHRSGKLLEQVLETAAHWPDIWQLSAARSDRSDPTERIRGSSLAANAACRQSDVVVVSRRSACWLSRLSAIAVAAAISIPVPVSGAQTIASCAGSCSNSNSKRLHLHCGPSFAPKMTHCNGAPPIRFRSIILFKRANQIERPAELACLCLRPCFSAR